MGILRNVGSFVSSLFSDGKISYRTSEPSTLTQSNAKPSEPPPPPKPAEAQLTSFQHATVELAPFYPASWSRAPANFGTPSEPFSYSNTSIKTGGLFTPWQVDVVTGVSGSFDVEGTSIRLVLTLSKSRLKGTMMGTVVVDPLPPATLDPIIVSGVDCLS